MSKKIAEWTDTIVNGESSMPDDPFTFTDTSTYMLDGFDFDKPMGEGTEESARLPETKGLSGLPDGLVRTGEGEVISFQEVIGEEGPDLAAMLSEAEGALPPDKTATFKTIKAAATALNDINWLDPTQEQAPARLPNNERKLNSKPDLAEAWGVERRTDGFGLVPNMDKDIAAYRKSLKEKQVSGLPNVPDTEVFKSALKKAARRSHYGHDLNEIKKELVATLGMAAYRAKKAMQIIEDEHGLSGRVFVRASVFPGIKKGKWVPELKRIAKTAKYVITDDAVVAARLGMQMVSEVPWAEALPLYAVQLKTAGYKFASKGEPKAILKAAFLNGPMAPVAPEAPPKPVMKPQIATAAEAKAEMEKVGPPPKAVQTPEEKAGEQKRKVALVKMARWVKEGRLSREDALRIHKAGGTAVTMLREAAEAMAPKAAPEYRGAGEQTVEAQGGRSLSASVKVSRQDIAATVQWVREKMTEGMMGKELDALLTARFSAPVLKASGRLVKAARETHEGLSGTLYVDASVYASPAGSTGCEKAASKHRSNGIKHVLAMPRCASCVNATEGVCQQFNKRLVAKAPVKNAKDYQKKALELANASDAEVTASLFNPREYALTNDALTDIPLDTTASIKPLGDVLFGGAELETKE